MKLGQEKLAGWGNNSTAWSMVAFPKSEEELAELAKRQEAPILAYGKGRSYGDTPLNGGGIAVKFDNLDRVISFDAGTGELVCESGISLDSIVKVFLPKGWFLPVTPGTAFPTLGGCLSLDVHGKNHHQAGTLGEYVNWLDLITADGKTIRCSNKKNKNIFHATIGGLGLTGFIYRISLSLKKVESAWIQEEAIPASNLKEMMDVLATSANTFHYSVAWVDCAARGEELGRGQVLLGNHATPDLLPFDTQRNPFDIGCAPEVEIPFTMPVSMVWNETVTVFNNLKYKLGGEEKKSHVVPMKKFFYPLDAVHKWNHLYGPRGFIQYQFVVGFDSGEDVVREILETAHSMKQIPSLVVLKTMGEENRNFLSFPESGWTFAMDFPVTNELPELTEKFDRIILEAGGRNYLAKDSNLSPETFRKMYPRFSQWHETKMKIDPDWRFSSNMSRRLKMEDGV